MENRWRTTCAFTTDRTIGFGDLGDMPLYRPKMEGRKSTPMGTHAAPPRGGGRAIAVTIRTRRCCASDYSHAGTKGSGPKEHDGGHRIVPSEFVGKNRAARGSRWLKYNPHTTNTASTSTETNRGSPPGTRGPAVPQRPAFWEKKAVPAGYVIYVVGRPLGHGDFTKDGAPWRGIRSQG